MHLAIVRIDIGHPFCRIGQTIQSFALQSYMKSACGIVREGLSLFGAFESALHSIRNQTDTDAKARPATKVAAMVGGTQEIIAIVTIAVATAFQQKVDFGFGSSTVIAK